MSDYMAAEYVAAYYSYLDYMDQLSDEECGRLFKACLIYGKTGTAPDLPGNERFVWPGIKSQIDRDQQKYAEKCRKQAENVRKRWDTKNTAVYDGINGIPSCTNYTNHTKEKENAKEKDIKDKTPSESKRKPFCVPSLEEVRAYCRSRNSPVNPEAFHDYYTAKGWVVGRSPMKDWRAAVRNWERNEKPTASAEKEDPYADVIV